MINYRYFEKLKNDETLEEPSDFALNLQTKPASDFDF